MSFRPQSFSILPPVIKNLLIINGILFLIKFTGISSEIGFDIEEQFSLFHWRSSHFKPWQIVTHMFMHANFMHLLYNMFALWMFGNTIENLWGSKRFLNFYLITGIGASILYLFTKEIQLQMIIDTISPEMLEQACNLPFRQNFVDPTLAQFGNIINTPMVGASGAVYAILMAYGLMFPNSIIHIYFVLPVKMKYFIMAMVLFSIYGETVGNDNIAHLAHLSGMLIAYILIKYWKKNNYLY